MTTDSSAMNSGAQLSIVRTHAFPHDGRMLTQPIPLVAK
jgi:hypothetical protein